jgi:hypothetical protein
MSTQNVKFLTKVTPSDVGGKEATVRFVLGNKVEVVCCLEDYTESMVQQLAIHGLSQKVGDAASGFSKARDFHGAFGSMQAVADNLLNGLWASRSGSSLSDLVQALCNLQGLSVEDAQAAVDKADEEQLSTLKKHPAVRKEIADIVSKRLASAAETAPDLGTMLADFGM